MFKGQTGTPGRKNKVVHDRERHLILISNFYMWACMGECTCIHMGICPTHTCVCTHIYPKTKQNKTWLHLKNWESPLRVDSGGRF